MRQRYTENSGLLEERITNSTLAIALGFYKSKDKEERERSGEERERIGIAPLVEFRKKFRCREDRCLKR